MLVRKVHAKDTSTQWGECPLHKEERNILYIFLRSKPARIEGCDTEASEQGERVAIHEGDVWMYGSSRKWPYQARVVVSMG